MNTTSDHKDVDITEITLPDTEFIVLFLTKLGLTTSAQEPILAEITDRKHWPDRYVDKDFTWCSRLMHAVESAWISVYVGGLRETLTDEVIQQFGFTEEYTESWKRAITEPGSMHDLNRSIDLIEIAVRLAGVTEIWQAGVLVPIVHDDDNGWCEWKSGMRIS